MSAKDIYEVCCDMDYRDYTETAGPDLEYIQSVIDQYGAENALEKMLDVIGL